MTRDFRPALARRLAATAAVALLGASGAAHAAPPEEITAKITLGTSMSVVPTPVTEALEAALDSTALAQWFCDPEQCKIRENYRAAAVPVVVAAPHATVPILKTGFHGPVSEVTAAKFNAVVKDELMIAADELAFRETLHRLYTATQKKDKQATALQEQTRTALMAKTERDKALANQAWADLETHMKTSGIDSNSGDASVFLASVRKTGFPAYEVQLMRSLGLTAAEIAQTRTLALQYAKPAQVPKSFVAAIPGVMKINSSNATMRQCKCAPPQ
jgi:hypothetical protein